MLFMPRGVFHGFCAGLGVMFTKSEKLNGCPGVFGKREEVSPPSVVMSTDEGRLVFFGGGVEGGSIRVLVGRLAGDGDAAK